MADRQRRSGDVSDEIMIKFDRLIEIEAAIERLEDEHTPLLKDLNWRLLGDAFGPHWVGSVQSPADKALDHDQAQGSRRLGAGDWPLYQRDRRVLLEAHATWKKRKQA